jgi:Mg-chelatase subunit ChlD
MEGAKISEVKRALIAAARELLAMGDERCKVGMVSFATEVRILCRPTADLAELQRAVGGLHASGTTAMDDGIRQAVELTLGAPAGTDRDVVLLTDGMPDGHRRANTLAVAKEALAKGVTLSSLNIAVGGAEVDADFLRNMTPITFKIEVVKDMAGGITTLLARAAEARVSGLLDQEAV